MDDTKLVYSRQVFSITDMMSTLGGLFTIIMGCFRLVYYQYASTEIEFSEV